MIIILPLTIGLSASKPGREVGGHVTGGHVTPRRPGPTLWPAGPQRLVCRIPGSGQAQCFSRRHFAPFTSSTHRAFHGECAGNSDSGRLAGGCEIRSATTQTQTVINKEIKRAQGFCPWSPSQEPEGHGAGDQSSSAPAAAAHGRTFKFEAL
jgi:hypothetical protein